ncbi:MAG: MFS transporter [Polyangiaceae bacterium]|nr:MFS transporter [Polyangiaceae bacterium]
MRASRPFVLATLGSLYLVQGLPYGFQAEALPSFLAERGVTLESIGFSAALAAPWMCKALFAPLVDRFGSSRIGRRKSWILPLTVLLAASAIAAAFVAEGPSLTPLMALIFLMNLFAAAQDVAVDGLAVDLLEPSELGAGNAIQVIGYRLGMIMSGGVLVWASKFIGWNGLFFVVAAISTLGLLAAWSLREPAETHPSAVETERPSMGEILRLAWTATKANGGAGLLAVIATYKMGESMAEAMWKPFLVKQAGYTPAELGLWVGTYGAVAAILGSVVGGFLARRFSFPVALFIPAAFRVLGIAFQWALVKAGFPSKGAVIGVTVFEHFFAGMITPIMFALMMSRVDRSIAATHYTFLATIEVFGKAPTKLFSGVVAKHFGFSGVFAASALASLGFLALVPLAGQRRAQPKPESAAS